MTCTGVRVTPSRPSHIADRKKTSLVAKFQNAGHDDDLTHRSIKAHCVAVKTAFMQGSCAWLSWDHG
jgi:hypothetical protein